MTYDNELHYRVQWGSEIRPFKIQEHLKNRNFEGRSSKSPYVVRFQMVMTIQKPDKIAYLD